MNSDQIIKEIEDYLVPHLKLDLGEARLYYHLFRHSRLVGKHDVLVSITQLSEVLNCSKNAVKPRIRSLQNKGIVDITNTGWAGTRIKVLLPAEIEVEAKDIETIDFYKDPGYRLSILEREQGRCFYCRRALTDEDSGLDHAEPQKANGTNSSET